MGLTNVPLDPTKTGRESLELEANLCKSIVGQQEAIRETVNIYQMYVTGMNAPGRPIGNLLFLRPHGIGQNADRGSYGRGVIEKCPCGNQD